MYIPQYKPGLEQIPSHDYMEQPSMQFTPFQEGPSMNYSDEGQFQFPYMNDQEGPFPQYQGAIPGYQGMPPFTPRRDPRYYIRQVSPIVQYGITEGPKRGWRHAMTEVALISYLLGRGYDLQTAYRMVESWEMNEMFPTNPSGR